MHSSRGKEGTLKNETGCNDLGFRPFLEAEEVADVSSRAPLNFSIVENKPKKAEDLPGYDQMGSR